MLDDYHSRRFRERGSLPGICARTSDRMDGTRSPRESSARVERFTRDSHLSIFSRTKAAASLRRSPRARPSRFVSRSMRRGRSRFHRWPGDIVVPLGQSAVREYVGAVGLFVKSGKLLIESVRVDGRVSSSSRFEERNSTGEFFISECSRWWVFRKPRRFCVRSLWDQDFSCC